MTTVLRLTRYAAMGFAGGAILTITAGIGCAIYDSQSANRRARTLGEALQGRWLG